jgi:gliding motility-associated-like protein
LCLSKARSSPPGRPNTIKNSVTYPGNSLLIFDAWNQRVLEQEGYANTWAGKNMRGEILPDATYYYILKFKHSAKLYSGYITLMRNTQ